MEIGSHCDWPDCNRLDFLPIKCKYCFDYFCSDHINYENHKCEKYEFVDRTVSAAPIEKVPCPVEDCSVPGVRIKCDFWKLFKIFQKCFLRNCFLVPFRSIQHFYNAPLG